MIKPGAPKLLFRRPANAKSQIEGYDVSRDGQKLLYASDRKMMVVESMSEETFRPAKPRELFECEFVNELDVSPDGKEFLRLQPDVSAAVNRFNPNSEMEKGSLWSKGCGHGD